MDKEHIHFIAIGGIGMSAVAKLLLLSGYKISGCDKDINQDTIKELKYLGCLIYEGNNTKNCKDITINKVVYSSSIKDDNEELLYFRNMGISIYHRAYMLSLLVNSKYLITVTGSHGKTTTSSLISTILLKNKLNPLIAIGGWLYSINSNASFGDKFAVIEADESDRSFYHFKPDISVITNIDLEHLDVYKDIDDIKNSFYQFCLNIKDSGKLIISSDDLNLLSIADRLKNKNFSIVKYGLNEDFADIFAKNIILEKDFSTYDLYIKDKNEILFLGNINVNMAGIQNVYNSLASIAVSRELSIKFDDYLYALSNFQGVDRRFSYKGKYLSAELFDDYGHHPTEIFYTLKVARKRANKKLVVLFQPQRYTRTYKLWNDFIDLFAFSDIDYLIITDIYSANENVIDGVNSKNLVDSIKNKNPLLNVNYIQYDYNLKNIRSFLKSIISKDDLLLTLGAGKVNRLYDFKDID